jgi:hypothetical protein
MYGKMQRSVAGLRGEGGQQRESLFTLKLKHNIAILSEKYKKKTELAKYKNERKIL